jgi:hypothetical protein
MHNDIFAADFRFEKGEGSLLAGGNKILITSFPGDSPGIISFP